MMAESMHESANSQFGGKSMVPHRNIFRPNSEFRLNRIVDNLAMSNEEKVLKRNYGMNYDNHLTNLSKQINYQNS